MEKITLPIALIPFLVIVTFGRFRAFLRAGLKSDLIKAVGVSILVIAAVSNSHYVLMTGFIIFSIGWIMSVTFEHDKMMEIYKGTTIIDRFIGNVPIMKDRKDFRFPKTYKKVSSVVVGLVCLLLTFIQIYVNHTFDMFVVMLGVSGVIIILFSLLSKNKV